ncbi:zinc ABC transporter substrate-binding protein [bacterium]|nr:zinc ABC transporter substrate-binding protein [bacterium]
MKSAKRYTALILCLTAGILSGSPADERITVVTTFSDFASIAREIGGDRIIVDYLSHGDQDPHFVPPKPSLALKLKKADLLVSTGCDLEMWLPTLVDKARNKNIMDGAVGFITASPGIDILEKPTGAVSRSEGDVHLLGNPHIQTSAMNWKKISANILIGLKRVDPENSAFYEQNQQRFVDRVDRAMFGDDLVEMFGGDQLESLLEAGTLFEFLETEYEGEKLLGKLGGWLKQALPFRGKDVIAYHKNWAYFARDFGLNVIGFIEVKPGIPPTPKHVEDTIKLIEDSGVDLMLVASYFERRKPSTISQKTGIKALFLPVSVGEDPDTSDNFKLMNYWIDSINAAIAE